MSGFAQYVDDANGHGLCGFDRFCTESTPPAATAVFLYAFIQKGKSSTVAGTT
jgi:hypothetical protein